MDLLISLLCILSSCALVLLHHLLSRSRSKTQNLPPGPTPLPIVGDLLKLGSKPHESLAELAKIHGPVMSLKLGGVRTVVISSSSVAKQVLQKHDALFCNRTIFAFLTACKHSESSVVFLPVGDKWRGIRKICNTELFATWRLDASQSLRRKKLEDLLCHVRKCCGGGGVAVDIGQATFDTALNLMSNTFFSADLVGPNSSNSLEFKDLLWEMLVEAATPNVSDIFPLFNKLDPQGIRRRLETNLRKVLNLFDTVITQRIAAKNACFDECNDTLDNLLKISQDTTQDLSLTDIRHLLVDLFFAGSETTSSTIEWAMAELLCNPDKMNKAKEELDHVVGKGIALKEEDIAQLQYLQCIIKETFRIHPPVPFLVPRKTDSDVELCGFTVLKNTQVLVNIWAIGRDLGVWENPNLFEPERFLGVDIDFRGHDFDLLPFGAGRRICPGLPLAMRMLPLMLGSLINCYEWKSEDGVGYGTMDMNDKIGATLRKAQPLRIIPVSII